MPSTKSAEREARVGQKRHLHNKSIRSQVKTDIAKAEGLISSGKIDPARGAVATAIRSLDKAAEKQVIHRNNAARRKSRLVKKLNQAVAKPSAETKPEKTE